MEFLRRRARRLILPLVTGITTFGYTWIFLYYVLEVWWEPGWANPPRRGIDAGYTLGPSLLGWMAEIVSASIVGLAVAFMSHRYLSVEHDKSDRHLDSPPSRIRRIFYIISSALVTFTVGFTAWWNISIRMREAAQSHGIGQLACVDKTYGTAYLYKHCPGPESWVTVTSNFVGLAIGALLAWTALTFLTNRTILGFTRLRE